MLLIIKFRCLIINQRIEKSTIAPLLIQAYVENAISAVSHGMSAKNEGGRMIVR